MTSINVRYCDIARYLREGEFFRSLSEDDPEGIIQIPADCYAKTMVVADLEQFTQLLRVMVFWMLDNIPRGIVKFCAKNDIEVWRDVVVNLPGGDKSPLVKGLVATFSDKNKIRFSEALSVGDWDVIVSCMDMMDPVGQVSAIQAAGYGNLRALKLLREKGFAWNEYTCTVASQNGHLDCLQFAHEHDCPWDVSVYIQAMIYGHLHCIQYAHQQGLEWDAGVCQSAALYGRLACLQYLLVNGCPVDKNACNVAAQKGHLHCLQLLLQYNTPWDMETCAYAAMCPDIACLQYLHEHDCPWDHQTTTAAEIQGNLLNLRYAFEHGCEYNEYLMIAAAISENVACVQYLVEVQGLYMDENGIVFMTALLKGNLQCLQYLIDQGCPYCNAQFSADDEQIVVYDTIFTPNNPEFVQCLQCAVERGWCINQNCVDYLVSRDWDNCGEYLTQEGYVKRPVVKAPVVLKAEPALVPTISVVETKPLQSVVHKTVLVPGTDKQIKSTVAPVVIVPTPPLQHAVNHATNIPLDVKILNSTDTTVEQILAVLVLLWHVYLALFVILNIIKML